MRAEDAPTGSTKRMCLRARISTGSARPIRRNGHRSESVACFFLGVLFRILDVTLGRLANEYSYARAWPQRADVVHFTAGQTLAFSYGGEIDRLRLRSEDPARKTIDSRFFFTLLPNQVQLPWRWPEWSSESRKKRPARSCPQVFGASADANVP